MTEVDLLQVDPVRMSHINGDALYAAKKKKKKGLRGCGVGWGGGKLQEGQSFSMTGWGANYRRGNLREVWLGPKTRVLDGHTLPPGCCRPWLLCLFPRASPPSTTVPTHTHTHINIYMYINKHTHMHAATRDLQVVEQYWWQKYMTPRPEIAPMRAANETHADQHRIRTIKSTGANVSQWMNKNTHTDPLSPCLHQEQSGRLLLGYMNRGG